MSEKTSTSDIADTITRCSDAIAHRQTLIAEVVEKIASARERALAVSADAVLGRASEREAVNARAALEKLEADWRTWVLEVDGLKQRHQQLTADLGFAERQNQLERTAAHALEAISAAQALDRNFAEDSPDDQRRTVVGFAEALRDLILANNAASEVWPDSTASYRPSAFAPGGIEPKVRLEQLGALLWAHICRATGDTLAYQVPPGVSPLAGSSREVFNGLKNRGESPLFATNFCGSWPGIFEHAGRPDLAEKVRAALENGGAGKKAARKAAA
jgi:hypothetical protein